MTHPDTAHLAFCFVASLLAAAINSVAGGGTMLSFPVLVALGLPPITANATSTVGIWPGNFGSIWGFRKELGRTSPTMRWLLLPTMVGGLLGATLLRMSTPGTFDKLVPFLILFASVLFLLQSRVQEWLKSRTGSQAASERVTPLGIGLALLVGGYGGYFGAGTSIMLLSVLGILGMTDLLEMNALTSLFSFGLNGVAIVVFLTHRMVDFTYVPFMAIGAIIGGYGATGIARKIGRAALRKFIIAVGFTMATWMFVKMLR